MNKKTEFLERVPGIMTAVALAIVAMLASEVFPQPGAVCMAILLGIVLGNLLPEGNRLAAGWDFVERRVLPFAIALMGTELELRTLGKTGLSAFGIVIPSMVAVILLSIPLGRLLGFPVRSSLLLGIGNSVCGSSALLAAAPALESRKQELGVAIAAVNLMGMIGMLLLPPFSHAIGLSAMQTATLIGGSLQAVGQVAACGYSVSEIVGDQALVVKMLRVLMIGPIAMLLHHLFQPSVNGKKSRRLHVPSYIVGFIFCSIVASLLPSGNAIVPSVRLLAKVLMVIAMAAIGCRMRFRSLLVQGPKVLLLTGGLSIIQIGAILLLMRIIGTP